MENGREYLSILTESLKKKITILDEILLLNQKQLESVSGNEIDDDLFNEIIDKKDIYIKEINNLDKYTCLRLFLRILFLSKQPNKIPGLCRIFSPGSTSILFNQFIPF